MKALNWNQSTAKILEDITLLDVENTMECARRDGAAAFLKARDTIVASASALIAATKDSNYQKNSDEAKYIYETARALRNLVIFYQNAADVMTAYEQITSGDGFSKN